MNPDNDSRKKLFQGVVVGVLWSFVNRLLDIIALPTWWGILAQIACMIAFVQVLFYLGRSKLPLAT